MRARRGRLAVLALTVAFAPGGLHGAEITVASPSSSSRGVGVQVWLPLDAATPPANTNPTRSSAMYRVEQRNCPPGTWRWLTRADTETVEIDIASALIVRLELAGAPPEVEERLAQAAEKVAETFRVRTGAEVEDIADVMLRFSDGQPPLETVQKAWETSFDARLEVAAATILEACGEESVSTVRLSAIIARERVKADCAPVEVCDAGSWRLHGYRAKSTRRTALAPVFFNSSQGESADGVTPAEHAADLAGQLGAWLQVHYVREASAGAILADGGDPRQVTTRSSLQTASR